MYVRTLELALIV